MPVAELEAALQRLRWGHLYIILEAQLDRDDFCENLRARSSDEYHCRVEADLNPEATTRNPRLKLRISGTCDE
jgi:hypothetical protein